MNAQLKTGEVLAPTTTAIAEFNATEAGLALLREQLAEATFDCTTTEGDKQARETRRTLVGLRTELEAKRKELKGPLLERGRLIDAEASRITGEIVKLEQPIDDLIRAEEARVEAARAERARIKREREGAVNAQIDRIRNLPLTYVAATAEVIAQTIAEIEGMKVAEVFDAADVPRVEEARAAALAGLQRALDGRCAADAEAARLAQERAELERQRAEQAEAQRIADEAAAAARAEADRLAAQQREEEAAAARAEQERVAEAQRAEQERLDAERAELERQRLDAERREAEAKALRDLEEADRAAEAAAREQQAWRDARTVDVVFQKQGDTPYLTFVEIETIEGRSVRVGEWIERADGLCAIRIVLAEPLDNVPVESLGRDA
jgi:hypothetical protein